MSNDDKKNIAEDQKSELIACLVALKLKAQTELRNFLDFDY